MGGVLFKKAVLKNFVIFTGKDLCWSLFLIKNIAKFFEEQLQTAASENLEQIKIVHKEF